jgi:hypothetical protein
MKRFVRIFAGVIFVAGTNVPGSSQTANTAPLRGGAPIGFNILPPLPPDGFYAWCQTERGLCVVRGNAPIPSGSSCHCAEYPGRTV